jgi:Icc-related predicted phosphoesterase
MRILAISDLHGQMSIAAQAAERLRPDLLVSCGDWGDPDQVSRPDFDRFLALCPVFTTFGNHDRPDLLSDLQNRDGSRVLLAQGEVRKWNGLRIAAIGGIWANRTGCRTT